jgi:uncharacterized protein YjeT (DUF2065 family)
MAVDTHVGVHAVLDSFFGMPRPPMRMRLQDHNETGVGFLVDEADDAHVETGDLIAMRLYPDRPFVIGEIVRKRAASASSGISVGVRLISRDAVALALEFESSDDQPGSECRCLYIPGLDRSGRHDAIVVPEGAFRPGKVLRLKEKGEVLRMSLNRVRRKGRGWVVAGFEIVVDEGPAAQGAASSPAPVRRKELTLELAEMPNGQLR